jgi:3-dehydroquinate synthase II
MEIWSEEKLPSEFPFSPDRILSENSSNLERIEISNNSDRESIRNLIGMVEWILVRCSDWTMIPLENLIADVSGTGTKICAEINQLENLQGAIFALEIGVDAVLIPPVKEMWSKAHLLGSNRNEVTSEFSNLTMIEVTVSSIEDGGIGERVCIDLIERMNSNEGLCIGSFSSCMVLVQAEVNENPHVPPRPFRVNAGGIHAYVLSDDDSTHYLEELNSGMSVSIISSEGNIRKSIVGRVKIEHRPFLLIRFESTEKIKGQIFLQQAETVRLLTSEGKSIPVTDLKVGEKVLAMTFSSAMHMGKGVPSLVKEV